MSGEVGKVRSPQIRLAYPLVQDSGMRIGEIQTITWGQINFEKKFLAVGRS